MIGVAEFTASAFASNVSHGLSPCREQVFGQTQDHLHAGNQSCRLSSFKEIKKMDDNYQLAGWIVQTKVFFDYKDSFSEWTHTEDHKLYLTETDAIAAVNDMDKNGSFLQKFRKLPVFIKNK